MLTLEQSQRADSTADSQQGDEPTALTWWLASFKASGLGIVGSGQRTDAGIRQRRETKEAMGETQTAKSSRSARLAPQGYA